MEAGERVLPVAEVIPGAGRSRSSRAALGAAVLGLVAGFIVLFLVTQWSRLPTYDWHFQPGWLALSTGTGLLFLTASALTWLGILRGLGERLGCVDAQDVFAKSLVARYVPTSLLAIVGRVVLAQRQGVGKRACLASIAYEIGCSLAAAVAAGSYFVVTLPPLQGTPARFAIFAVVVLALAALHPRVFKPLADGALRCVGREPLARALPFSRVLGLVAIFVALWALVGLSLFAFAAAVHPLELSNLPYVAASYPVGYCIALLTFVVPAGLASRDALIAAALGTLVAANVAIAIAIAFRIFQTALEVIYLGAASTAARRRGRRRTAHYAYRRA